MKSILKTTAYLALSTIGGLFALAMWAEHPEIMATTLVLCVTIGGLLFWLGMREIRIKEENRQRHNETIAAIQLGQPTWGGK